MWPWLSRALSLDGTLCKKEQRKRTIFFVINAVNLLFVSCFSIVLMQKVFLNKVIQTIFILTALFSVIFVLSKRPLTVAVVVGVCYSYAFGILLLDLLSRCVGETFWAALVLIVDGLLVMEAPARYTVGLVCFTVVWLIVMSVEEYMRIGLFDIPGLVPQDGDLGRRLHFNRLTECVDLPCKANPAEHLLAALQVFVIDFIATRGFAREMLKEQASMERTINTVQEIASLLAGYDVEKVAELLGTHKRDLPEEMTVALRRLEKNLRVYKAYLPRTCLPFESDQQSDFTFMDPSELSEFDRSSASSSEQSSSMMSIPVLGVSVSAQPLGLSSANTTLLTVNIKHTLRRLKNDTTSFCELFTTLLQTTLKATGLRRGMVDVFVGDRIHCSFNASKECASHATSALHTATLLMYDDVAPHVNMAIATGKVLRGDMGCAVMRRFSMVGTLVRDLHYLERAGRMLGCDVLCNRLCFVDSECEHQLRLVPCKVELDVERDPETVAELVVPTETPNPATTDEWMYVIGGKNCWEGYNMVVRRYLQGEVSGEAVATAAAAGRCALTPVNVIADPLQCQVVRFPVLTGPADCEGKCQITPE